MKGPIRSIVEHLVRNVDVEESAKNSFKDFHAKGMDYVNLVRSKDFTAKLYFCDHSRIEPLPGWSENLGLVVNPHNHLYAFQTYVIKGSVANLVYSRQTQDSCLSATWHEHLYKSPVRGGEKRSVYAGPVTLYTQHYQYCLSGDGYEFDDEGIHSISVAKNEPTVLFLLQYRSTNKAFTSLFTPTEEMPSLNGLYSPMTPKEVEAHLNQIF